MFTRILKSIEFIQITFRCWSVTQIDADPCYLGNEDCNTISLSYSSFFKYIRLLMSALRLQSSRAFLEHMKEQRNIQDEGVAKFSIIGRF